MVWDTAGNITDANDRFLEMVGYSREDLEAGALRWIDMTPAEYRAADEEALREIAFHGTSKRYEKQYVRKDGTRVSVLLAVALLTESPNAGIAFAIDLTERKRLEDDVRRSDRKARQEIDRERERLSAFSRDIGVAFSRSAERSRVCSSCARS